MDIHELIAAMKSDRLQPEMIIEAFELLANQSPPDRGGESPQSVQPQAHSTSSEQAESTCDPLPLIEEMQSNLEAAEVKIESMEMRLTALEAAPKAEPQQKTDWKTEVAPLPKPKKGKSKK